MASLHENYYIDFRNGNEAALNYVYNRYYQPLFYHGRRIVDDDFAVSCIVQEAFLKGWKFRETMESMKHIYCFIRLDVSWKCYAYLRNPANRFHRGFVHNGAVENYSNYFFDEQMERINLFDEQKLKVIEEALPYLPSNRQTIMTLYFKYGFSYKKIARRFGTSNQAISAEVQKSLESLKKIIHAQKKLTAKTISLKRPETERCTEILDAETQHIFKMRFEQKLSFAAIAEKMNLSQPYIQQQYIKAHQKIKALKAFD